MKNIYVEYIDHITNTKNTEVLSWSAFCDLSMERHIEVTSAVQLMTLGSM